MKSNLSRISDAISSLNAQYGRGTVQAIRLSLSGVGGFDYKPYSCAPKTRRFRILSKGDKITVFACGHQVTV